MSLYSKKLTWFDSVQKTGEQLNSGKLISLFNVLDSPTFEPNYIYSITVPCGRVKGPYIHSLRTTLCSLLSGEVDLIYKVEDKYEVININTSLQVVIPPKVGFCLLGKSNNSLIVNICDYPWYPETKECLVPDFDGCPFLQSGGNSKVNK